MDPSGLQPMISVLVGIRERHHFIPRLVRSLKAQTHQNWELILVDQSKTPTPAEVFQNDPQIHRLVSSPGLSRARNTGLRNARGEFISILDDDCLLPEDAFESAILFFNSHPASAAIVGRVKNEEGKMYRKISNSPTGTMSKWKLLTASLSVGIILRRQCLIIHSIEFDESLGLGANSPYTSGEEADLLLNLHAHGEKITQVDDYIVIHPDDHSHSTSRLEAEGRALGFLMKRYRIGIFVLTFRSILSVLLSFFYLISFNPSAAKSRLNFCKERIKGFLTGASDVR